MEAAAVTDPHPTSGSSHDSQMSALSNGRSRSRFALLCRQPSIWLFAFAALFAPNMARAELLDEITVTRVDGMAVIEVRFTLRVQYLRHFPKTEGDTLRVNVSLVPTDGIIPLAEREIRRSPQNDLLPPFTVTYPDPSGAVLIEFESPVKFKVGRLMKMRLHQTIMAQLKTSGFFGH